MKKPFVCIKVEREESSGLGAVYIANDFLIGNQQGGL
jgi:hypothetical protein